MIEWFKKTLSARNREIAEKAAQQKAFDEYRLVVARGNREELHHVLARVAVEWVPNKYSKMGFIQDACKIAANATRAWREELKENGKRTETDELLQYAIAIRDPIIRNAIVKFDNEAGKWPWSFPSNPQYSATK